jgi:Uma2 family endonuclease
MSPSPNWKHQTVAANVFRLIDSYLQRRPIGVVRFAPVDVYLSDTDVVQPDVLFVSHERKNLLAHDGVHGGPDLVVEILSPSNGLLEKRRKRPLYARHGVKEEWLIDPNLEQIHRYDFTTEVAKPVQLVDGEETFTTPVFPGLVVSAVEIFKR